MASEQRRLARVIFKQQEDRRETDNARYPRSKDWVIRYKQHLYWEHHYAWPNGWVGPKASRVFNPRRDVEMEKHCFGSAWIGLDTS